MRMEAIRREIEEVKNRIERMPRIWRFRGKRVVPVDTWELEDWSTFPDEYHIGFSLWLKPPRDWWEDYLALLTKLEDPLFGQQLCSRCAIKLAQEVRESIERFGWAHRGGEKAREEFYKTCESSLVSEFRREDAMRRTCFRLYNETAGANNRACDIINYFKCPYGKERDPLTEDGYQAEKVWKVVEWYDAHWNPNQSTTPSEQERKWYHRTEPSILDVTDLEDILKARSDGRIQKIAEEQQRYRTENPP
jgi:hypothetical protein